MALSFNQLVSPQSQAEWLQTLLTALQGVGPVLQGSAPGTNQLFGTGIVSVQGPAQAASNVVVRIASSGNAASSGAAAFQYSVDGGLTFYPAGTSIGMNTIGPGFTYVIAGINVTLTFENGAYTTAGSGGNSFVQGETYSFQCTTPTFPVTNWPSVGVANALTQVDAQALADLNILVANAIAGGFTQSWINPPLVNGVPTPPPDGWLDLLAQNFYNLTRDPALQMQGFCTLTAAATSGPFTILPGQIFASTGNGQFIFTNLTGGTLAKGGTLKLLFQAVNPGASYNQVTSYNVGSSGFWVTSLLTPLAGVTITNPLISTGAFTQAGPGSGSIAASGTATGEFQILIKIIDAVSGGHFAYSTNGGSTYSSTIPIATTSLGAAGITATFTGSFDAGALYAFSTAWVTQYGVDAQTSLSLAVECQDQWATLSPAGPTAQYVIWAMQASPEVEGAYVIADPVTPGQIDITLFGPNVGGAPGPVSSNAVTAVYNYILARIGLCLSISVGSITQLAVLTEAAYIICQSAYRNTVINSIQTLFNKYAGTINPQGTVELSEIAAIIQQAPGVIEINPLTSLQMKPGAGAYAAADITLAANQTAQISAPTIGSFQFV